MGDGVVLEGLVLQTSPVRETDRRLVVLTTERGRITVFARGARRMNSPFSACQPFLAARFELYEGREAYTLKSFEALAHFEELKADMEAVCYGSYFLELSGYYAREGVEAKESVILLFQALRALTKKSLKKELVRAVFELRLMKINGEYMLAPPCDVSDTAAYAWSYILSIPCSSLFGFALDDESLLDLERAVEMARERFIDRHFKSLEILKSLEA